MSPPGDVGAQDQRSRRVLLGVLATLVAIVVSNNSAGSLAQPAIAAAFNAGPAEAGWVVFGFSATFAVSTAVWGGLANRFGLGRALAIGVLIFSAASLIAALAPALEVLIGARMIQGIGAGAIPTVGTSLIATRFDAPDRPRAFGAIVAAVGLGTALGPLLGGAALEVVGWQGPVAFGVVAGPAAILLAREGSTRVGAGRLDVIGAVLVAAAVLGVIFLVNRLPVEGPTAVALAIAAAVAVIVAVLVRRSDRPGALVPRRVVTDPRFLRLAALGFTGMTAFLGPLVLVPVAGARAHGLAGISLGLLVLPMALFGSLISVNNARIQAVLGRPTTTSLSLASLSVTALLLATLGPDAAPPLLAAALLPMGIGLGLLQPPLVNELTGTFEGADRPLAVGLYNLAFFLGGSVGAALSTALVQQGLELPVFGASSVPGFSTAQLLLALGPAIAVMIIRRSGAAAGR